MSSKKNDIKLASPKVRKFARELGTNISDIKGSQRSGRITEEDVKNLYLQGFFLCKINIKKFLIYVLLATVCDVMPLRYLNRLIAIIALKEFDLKESQAINEFR